MESMQFQFVIFHLENDAFMPRFRRMYDRTVFEKRSLKNRPVGALGVLERNFVPLALRSVPS